MYIFSAVHSQITCYSQRVPGYLSRYFVSANEIYFEKKNQPRFCPSNEVRPRRKLFPSLCDFNRPFEIIIGELFKIWGWNMFFFLITPVWPLKCKFASLLCWLKRAEPLHNQKVNKPSFHDASCQLAPSPVRQSEHTQYSTYQQQCNGSNCTFRGMNMTTLPKLVEFSCYPL